MRRAYFSLGLSLVAPSLRSPGPVDTALYFGLNGTDYWSLNTGANLEPLTADARDVGVSIRPIHVLYYGATGGVAQGATTTISGVDPTIAAGGCTSPAVTWANGTAAFKLTLGTMCTGVKTITLTMPTAANGWVCDGSDVTAPQTYVITQASTTTTAVVLNNYARVTGLAADFADSDALLVKCLGG